MQVISVCVWTIEPLQRCLFKSCELRTGAYGVFVLFNLIGVITAGFLADRMDGRFLLVMIYLLRRLAFVIPIFVGTNYPLLLAFLALVGIAFYATFPATIGLPAAPLGTTNLGLVVGMLTVGHSLGAAAGGGSAGMSTIYLFAMASCGLARSRRS
jgi:MFS family permease